MCSDLKLYLLAPQALVFDLDGDVIDSELLLHQPPGGTQHSLSFTHVADHDVAAHRIQAGGDRPDMKIVHSHDTGKASELFFEQCQINLRRRPLHQDVHGLGEQAPCARHDEKADAGADNRICQRIHPVVMMMRAAAMTPREPSMSLNTSKYAPRTFRLSEEPAESRRMQIKFTTRPISATASIGPAHDLRRT